MINIAICDDENLITSKIDSLIKERCEKLGLQISTDIFYSGERLVSSIEKKEYYDIIFMDIEMKGLNGIETAKIIRKFEKKSLLIYISSYEKYLIELFEVEPFRFLKKPIDVVKFNDILDSALMRVHSSKIYYEYHFENTISRIEISNILYFESEKRKIYIITDPNENRYFYKKMDEVENEFNEITDDFIRIHQSFLVNITRINDFGNTNVVLDNGTKLNISEERRKAVRRKYLYWLKKTLHKGGK